MQNLNSIQVLQVLAPRLDHFLKPKLLFLLFFRIVCTHMKNHIYFKFSGIEVAMVSPAYSRFLHGFSSVGHATSILKWQNEKGSLTQNVSWIFFITQSQHTHAHTHTHTFTRILAPTNMPRSRLLF